MEKALNTTGIVNLPMESLSYWITLYTPDLAPLLIVSLCAWALAVHRRIFPSIFRRLKAKLFGAMTDGVSESQRAVVIGPLWVLGLSIATVLYVLRLRRCMSLLAGVLRLLAKWLWVNLLGSGVLLGIAGQVAWRYAQYKAERMLEERFFGGGRSRRARTWTRRKKRRRRRKRR